MQKYAKLFCMSGKSVLTKQQWIEVRELYINGESVESIALKYDLPYQTIYHRAKRNKWDVRKNLVEETNTKIVSLSAYKENKEKKNILLRQFKFSELNECINVVINAMTRGLESQLLDVIKRKYPEKRISYHMVTLIKSMARKRIQKTLDLKSDTLIHEYVNRMDMLYSMALQDHDLKVACYVSEQKAKVLGLYKDQSKDNEFDIDKDMEKRIAEFDELNEKDITPPLLSDIM
jgi:hypothetical protein